MFVVGHTVSGLLSENPEISFDIVGSTGNIYKTTIGKVPTCDCPDGKSGNQCKHICYGKLTMSPLLTDSASAPLSDYLYIPFLLMACTALVYVLKAPGELQYQLAFLTSVSDFQCY